MSVENLNWDNLPKNPYVVAAVSSANNFISTGTNVGIGSLTSANTQSYIGSNTNTITGIFSIPYNASLTINGQECMRWDSNTNTLHFPTTCKFENPVIFDAHAIFNGGAAGNFVLNTGSYIPDSVLQSNTYIIKLEQKITALEARLAQAENNIAFRP